MSTSGIGQGNGELYHSYYLKSSGDLEIRARGSESSESDEPREYGEEEFLRDLEETKQKAAEGNPNYQYNLGVAYYLGVGFDQDYKQAHQRLFQAAGQGHVAALNNLGVLYFLGRGVKKNYMIATYYFSSAVEKGSISAVYNYAICLEYGLGCVQNENLAKKNYLIAARKGYVPAQEKLKELSSQSFRNSF